MGKETPYKLRKDFINLLDIEYVEYVDTVSITSLEQFMQFYNTLLENHHEGAMLRLMNGGYENKRSKNLLKFKPTDDDEFIFIDANEGTGNWSNMIKIVTVMTLDKTKTFNATFKGTQEEARKFLTEYQNLIGSEVTIYFNGYTGLGTPNYAQFDYNNFKKK
jgi:ATP-dependent DNA ligase